MRGLASYAGDLRLSMPISGSARRATKPSTGSATSTIPSKSGPLSHPYNQAISFRSFQVCHVDHSSLKGHQTRLLAVDAPPEEGENWDVIADDYQKLILPGAYHRSLLLHLSSCVVRAKA